MSRRTARPLVITAAIVATLAAPARQAVAAVHAISFVSLASLDLAFRFASAIQSDPKDQAKAQEAVIRDLLLLGEEEEARTRTEQVQGWRKGVLYAEIAEREAEKGNTVAA